MKKLYALIIIVFAFSSIGWTQSINWTEKTIIDEYGVPTDKYLYQRYDKIIVFVLKNEIAFRHESLYFKKGRYKLILIEDDGKSHNFVLNINKDSDQANIKSPFIIQLLIKNQYIRFEIDMAGLDYSDGYIDDIKGSINCKGFTAMYNKL